MTWKPFRPIKIRNAKKTKKTLNHFISELICNDLIEISN